MAELLAGALLIAAMATAPYTPVASFTTAEASRGQSVDVVDDGSGAHGLDVAAEVAVGSTCDLVAVTNRLGSDATVTVTLDADSREYGNLSLDGVERGDALSFELADDAARGVNVSVPQNSSLADRRIYFHVNATDTGFHVAATDRYATIRDQVSGC